MNRLLLIGLLAWVAAGAVRADTIAPPLVNYQGLLTDENGIAVPDGMKTLEFNLYDAPLVGNRVWGPQVFGNVSVVGGRFNVILGTTDGLGRSIADAFSSHQRYLGLKAGNPGVDIAATAEISPRQQILSAPFAVMANNGVPVGAVVPYAASVAPEGWLLCNGLAIPDGERYKNLRELIGAKTPDLRGRVIVGMGQGSGLTSRNVNDLGGEEAHQLTLSEIPAHAHSVQMGNNTGVSPDPWVQHADQGGGDWGRSGTDPQGGNGSHNNMQPFYVLNYVVKY